MLYNKKRKVRKNNFDNKLEQKVHFFIKVINYIGNLVERESFVANRFSTSVTKSRVFFSMVFVKLLRINSLTIPLPVAEGKFVES